MIDEDFDPFQSHTQELQRLKKEKAKLQDDYDRLQSHHRRACEMLADFANATNASLDSLQRWVIADCQGDPAGTWSSIRLCEQVLAAHVQRLNLINRRVMNVHDQLNAEIHDLECLLDSTEQSLKPYETWRSQLPDWVLRIEDEAFVLSHLAYLPVRASTIAEAVALALVHQAGKPHDPTFEA